MAIEVYKTNITDSLHARLLVALIHQAFPSYQANFDLQDCDRILRVVCAGGPVETAVLTDWLRDLGCQAEPLPDEVPVSWLPFPGNVRLLGHCLIHVN